MPRIHILPDRLVSQIAAGEVVERPASVVKELLENSLDAGATEVAVELAAGGKRQVRVTDDGCGMGRDDALLAFDRHATSKIGTMDDLETVATLGFRGEALASIAAVARVELTTAEQAGEGHRVRIEGGRVRGVEPASRARGTTVDVASLFFNVPARRKFLRAPRTELRRALEVVQGYALARPEVHFRVAHEGRELLDAPPAGADLAGARGRIGQVFGPELRQRLREFSGPAPGAGGSIWGLIGDPSTTRGRRYFVFVNRRLLRDRAVLATFYRAVREEWKSDDFPALFLFLDLPPREVDVNVHPQKAEVRFRDGGLLPRLFEILRRAASIARGEETAPARPLEQVPGAPLAWSGLGGRGPAATGWRQAGKVAEPAPSEAGGGIRLAEAVYAPLDRPPVPLTGRAGEPRAFRLLGQYKGTLILLEGPDGLYLVDQHVAHERILYERLRRRLAGEGGASQTLLEPVLLELSAAEALRLGELAAELDECGFSLTPMSGNTLALTALPAGLGAGEAEDILGALAREEEGEVPQRLAERLLDALAAGLACRAAVKMHDPLPAEQMEALVAELFAAEQPYACPHGRPIVLRMTDIDLERRFGRR